MPDAANTEASKPGTATSTQPPPTPVTCIINVTDGVDSTVEAFFLEIHSTDIDDEKLSDLRSLIVKDTRCVELLQFPFCLASGAVVQDSMSVEYYLSKCLKIDAKGQAIEVFMKDEKLPTETGWNDFVPSYYSSPLTGTNARHVSELEEKQWGVVVETNQLCYGISTITEDVTIVEKGKKKTETRVFGVQKPKYPATRKVLSDTVASSMVKNVELNLRIPRYTNDDVSYVAFRYSTSAAQESLARQGFSQTDISASGSGGAFGCSVDASASLSVAENTSNQSSTATSKGKATMSYNFPRVTMFLDELGLELTPQCEQDLKAIQDAAGYSRFLKRYGEFFSTTVQLGGSLFASEEYETSSDSSREATAKSLKAAAAVSLGGVGYSGSVSASHQQSSQEARGASNEESSKTLIWEANGGNTLLCNDPAAWAPSVAYYGNWRILKQGRVVRLMDLICTLEGFRYVKEQLPVWKNTGTAVQAPVGQRFTLNVKACLGGKYMVGHGGSDPGKIEIGPKVEKRTGKFLAWELASADKGDVATTVEYGKDYYLMHCESHLYPTFYDIAKAARLIVSMVGTPKKDKNGSIYFISGTRTRDYTMRFYDGECKGKTGTIETGDTVTLEFKGALGSLGFLAAETSGQDKIYVTKGTDGYSPLKLIYTEVTTPSESDESADTKPISSAGRPSAKPVMTSARRETASSAVPQSRSPSPPPKKEMPVCNVDLSEPIT
ncbi:hypothetical protein X797_008734 [Metarhizium robertsii]|uniref:MACPF domain-containing protein n=1 Tax=Metarhizium robertsii TaxID=568076 RepID=A0A0A1URM2_9HYPO|nr:hypothetical protein X797_008734 [Metarhizium robertsii]